MRRFLFFWLLWATSILLPPALADDIPPGNDNLVREFSGGGTTTTGFFKVRDHWEVRWNARQVVSVAVMSADGTIVAGAAGVLRGSLFVPLGGRYYLKVTDGTVPPPAPSAPTQAASTNAAPSDNPGSPATGTNAAPLTASDTNTSPYGTVVPPQTADTNNAPIDISEPSPSPVEISWHLQVVQLNASISADQALTVYTPFFIVPDTAVTPRVVLPVPVLTDDQARTVVSIKGENAQGTGFLMRSPDGTFVVTHLDLLAGNPNLKLTTSTGAAITTLALKAAADRDLALFTIQDNQFTYLPSPADAPKSVLPGDQLIIPDVGAPSAILLGKPGQVMGTNAERIDFDNRMGPGNTGAPVIHVKSGTVLALVASQKKVDVSDRLARSWPANPPPGSAFIIPYFGMRLGGVQNWETYDPARFLQETTFLRQFHQNTRYLDSYLNGRRTRFQGTDDGPPDNRFYLNNPKLTAAQDSYHQLANGADQNQQLEGARELLFDLQGFADTDLTALEGMKNLYPYDQTWAREEIAYRIALKKELDELGDNMIRMVNLARSR